MASELFASCVVFSSLSLCKLIQYALESQDPRLQGIEVQGDQIFGAGDSIKTRSIARQCKQPFVDYFIFLHLLQNVIWDKRITTDVCVFPFRFFES